MSTVAMLTLNCNRGRAADNATDCAGRQAEFLLSQAQAGRIDVAGLQLVSEAQVRDVTAAIGEGWQYQFAEAAAPFGNALLSRFPITATKSIPLPSEDLEARTLLVCTIDIPRETASNRLAVGVCHLENTQEHVRFAQLGKVLEEMNDVPDHVLLGDFNALRVDDYSAAQWASLCEFAAHAGWEKRQEACYQLMMQHKYRDAWEEVSSSTGCGDRTTFRCAPVAMMLRIDYIFAAPRCRLRFSGCQVLREEQLSNHLPLLVWGHYG
eukprot:jgi/Tetstr1/460737/TSEL_005922.t1